MTEEPHDDDELALTWLDSDELRGLLGLFDSFSRMAGTNAGSVAWWGARAWAAVNAELVARSGGPPATDPLPGFAGLTGTELLFLGTSLGGVYDAGGDGLRQWIDRLADAASAEVADRILRRSVV